jgi:hypothetical protein
LKEYYDFYKNKIGFLNIAGSKEEVWQSQSDNIPKPQA